jgi:hypothetical protein
MATLRILTEEDVPAVVALFERVYPDQRWTSGPACEAYFREMLFNNPWRGLDLPSWLAEADHRAVGLAGVVPRPMLFRGRSIRVAVGAQFMVDPDQRHSLTGLQLAKAVLSGTQDLFIADGSNAQARRLWEGIGGIVPLLHNLHWTRPLRPCGYLLTLLERTEAHRPLVAAARPLCAAVDALAARVRPNQFHRNDAEIGDRAFDEQTLLAHLPDVTRGNALQPVYDASTAGWLLAEVGRKTRHGALRARTVLDAQRQVLGWYLYYVQPGGVSELVELASRDGAFGTVLRQLLVDAWRHGALAVRGRLDPRHLETLSERHCWLRREDPWTLIHTRDAELAAAFHRGDAFISRLAGEWWLRFLGG